jgi:hypothetical protein
MPVAEIIDPVLPPPPPNRQELSYGQLGVFFLTNVLHLLTHRLCAMAE